MGLRQIRVDRHVEARWSPFDAAQHQVLHCIEADCSARDSVAHRGSNLIGAEYLSGAPGSTAATPSGLMLKAKNINGSSCVRFQLVGMRSGPAIVSAERSPQFSESSDEPSAFVDIELH